MISELHKGTFVEILWPEYVAGKRGIVVSAEMLTNQRETDRWLVQVIPDEFIVSLSMNEFAPLLHQQCSSRRRHC